MTHYDDGDLRLDMLPLAPDPVVAPQLTAEQIAVQKRAEYEATLFYSAGGVNP